MRSRISDGPKYNLKGYFELLLKTLELNHLQPISELTAQKPISGNETSIQIVTNSEIRCPHCGSVFQGNNITYCPHCGKGLDNVTTSEPLKNKKDLVIQMTNIDCARIFL